MNRLRLVISNPEPAQFCAVEREEYPSPGLLIVGLSFLAWLVFAAVLGALYGLIANAVGL